MRFPINSLILLAIFGLTACDAPPPVVITRAPLGPIPPSIQRVGDPQAGYVALTESGYVRCGIPMTAYRAVAEPPPPALQLARSDKHAGLPYSLTAWTNSDGVELAVSNCLSCHAGVLNGKLVVGLGNEAMDWTRPLTELAESVGQFVADGPEAAAWSYWADRLGVIAPYVQTATVGVNPANNLTLALFAHRDPETLAWSDTPLRDPPRHEPLPVSVPPWWHLKKKHAMFYSAQVRGDFSRFLMTAMVFCTDTVADARETDADAPDILAYLRTLTPPPYPFPIDTALLPRGESLYGAHCAGCHGTPTEFPNLVIGLDEVGTDPALALEAYEESDRFIDWHQRSFFGEVSQMTPARGYLAPPLDGLWATAPYFHNGSVPTLAAVIDPSRRPRYWTRDFADTSALDRDAVGWRHQALDAPPSSPNPRVYDTTRVGYGNGGHGYGEQLGAGDRQALLEYLKTL